MIIHTLIYRFADSVTQPDRDRFFAELGEVAEASGSVLAFGHGPHQALPADDAAKGVTGDHIAQFACAELADLRRFSELPAVHEFISGWRGRIDYEAAYANHGMLLGIPERKPAANIMHHTEHTVTVQAPWEIVWDVLVNVRGYARIFPPTREVTVLEESAEHQIARLVVDVSGSIQSWVSRRDIDRARRTIAYRQLENAPLMGYMGGEWRALPIDAASTQLVITHDFQVREPVDGLVAGEYSPEEAERLLATAVERNSVADLGAVKDESERVQANAEGAL